jgi:hypothetical protein
MVTLRSGTPLTETLCLFAVVEPLGVEFFDAFTAADLVLGGEPGHPSP